MTKLSCRFLALSAATFLACAPAHAEFIMPIGDSDTARLSFSGTGYVAYEDRPEYTTLNGGTNAGYERLRFLANVRLQFAYGDIGQAVWSEANVNARVNKIDPVNGADSTLDIIVGNTNETSYGGLNAVLGTGNFYGLVANGGVIMHGPGAGHTGSFPRSAAGTGFYDTFQRLHGNVSGRDDDVLVTGDPSGGTLAQITEDRGGSNSDIFLGFGHVSNDHHYGVQSSSNGEWIALNFGQKLTSTVGVNAVLHKVNSTNRFDRAVDDYGFDVILTHVTDRIEYGARFTGWGFGSSPTWNAQDRRRLRLTTSYAVTDRHAIGFNFDYEDFPVINARTGVPVREQSVRRLTLMYGYNLSPNAFLSAQWSRSETDVRSGSLAGSSQDINSSRLALNFIF